MRALSILAATLGLTVFAGIALAAGRLAPQTLAAPGDQQLAEEGSTLFATSCATCHGAEGQGTQYGPTLQGVGAASADFQLRTGRMPFTEGAGAQARRKPPAFDEQQIQALVAYVASLGKGPQIPQVSIDQALVPEGQRTFVGNCAPCHGATANGGAVGGGALAPALDQATPVQVAEAMLIGPGQMPAFDFDQRETYAIASYIDYLQNARHPGGFSIGGIGPVPEGFVAWVLGMALLFVIVVLIGRRWTAKGGDEEHVP